MGWIEWFCKINGHEQGPFTGQQLAKMAEFGQLKRSDEVRKSMDGEWVSAANVRGLCFATLDMSSTPVSPEGANHRSSKRDGAKGSRTWQLPSVLNDTPKELQIFWGLLAVSVIAACGMILANPPTETGWWIFKAVNYPYQLLVAVAFLLASGYLFLLSKWYSVVPNRFRCVPSIQAFLLCGGISVLLALLVYPVWSVVSTTELKGWFYDTVEYRNSLFAFMDKTGVIAGPVEEAAKLIAVLVVFPVRKLIRDRRSGLYYVTLCAFGFAMIENVTYFKAFNGILFVRANPAHAVFSSVWGAALGSWIAGKTTGIDFAKWLLFGVGLHSLWNFLVGLDLILFAICFVFTSWMGLQFIRNEMRGEVAVS